MLRLIATRLPIVIEVAHRGCGSERWELSVGGDPVEEIDHVVGSWAEGVDGIGDVVVDAVGLDPPEVDHSLPVLVGVRASGPWAEGVEDVRATVIDGQQARSTFLAEHADDLDRLDTIEQVITRRVDRAVAPS